MTTIIKNDIVLNPKTGRYNNNGVIQYKIKDIIYLGDVLEYIDFTECTANSPWVEIKFKGSSQRWIEQLHRIKLNTENIEK